MEFSFYPEHEYNREELGSHRISFFELLHHATDLCKEHNLYGSRLYRSA
jgi:hypothetical protein